MRLNFLDRVIQYRGATAKEGIETNHRCHQSRISVWNWAGARFLDTKVIIQGIEVTGVSEYGNYE